MQKIKLDLIIFTKLCVFILGYNKERKEEISGLLHCQTQREASQFGLRNSLYLHRAFSNMTP